jgi:1-acyl-sn-glycerol-3-phosphate acyltransferase
MIYFGLIYFLIGLLCAPYIYFFVRGKRKFIRAKKVKIFWAKGMCKAIGIKIDIQFHNNFEKNKNYVVCANHISYLDIILMYLILPQDFAFLGKSELLKWPIIRIFFKRGIDIPVYRNSISRAARCLEEAKVALINGRSVIVFPEGGWDDRIKELRRFKNGAFQLAIDSKVSILPVTFKNNYDLFTDSTDFSGGAKPGLAKVVVHDSIETSSLTRKDLISLRNQTFSIIQKELLNED